MRPQGNPWGIAPVLATRSLRVTSLLCALCLLPFSGCLDRLSGGDATETGNALAGTLVVEGGAAAAGARVIAVPEAHNPVLGGDLPDSLSATTDASGRYRFKALPQGRYNLQADHPSSGRRLLLRGLVLGGDERVLREKDMVAITGSLSLLRPDWVSPDGGTLYVPGTAYVLSLDSARRVGDRYYFDSLPPGVLPEVRYLSGGPDSADILVAQEPAVASGAATAVHPFTAWPYSAKLLLNTSASGVPLEKDLHDFPLLVRLTAPHFDPAKARADRGDLRFAKPDGTSLPYEIEAWEGGNVSAWVRVDTVHAGRAGQHLTVHWGNPWASAPADMQRVFDTASGFAGVWHLGEEAADTVTNGLYKDATQAGNHLDDRIASRLRFGVAGQGHSFINGDYAQAPNATEAVRLPMGFTLSTWFRSWPVSGKMGGDMISIGDNYGLRLGQSGRLSAFFWPAKPPADGPPWYSVSSLGSDFLDGEWHMATGTFDGGMLRLFLDGREVAAQAVPGPVDFRYGVNVTLGRNAVGRPGFEYTGDLDEVQIHSRARGVDWQKLTYENQKPGSGFPVLAP